MGIVEFLNARLDEDQAVVAAVEDNSAPFTGEWINDDGRVLRTRNRWVLAYKPNAEPWRPGVLDHIARYDPARVLAEVATKRRVLARHANDGYGSCEGCGCEYADISLRYAIEECPELRDLAAVYADYPDYDPAWRVE